MNRRDNKDLVVGFSPIIDVQGNDAKILVLGSAPSVKSLEQQEYYAHPQNAFWWIMSHIFKFDINLPYKDRQKLLIEEGVLVWDVLASCQRSGSLDSQIQSATQVANNIPELLGSQASIKAILCNGGTAFRLLKKHHPDLFNETYDILQMPSTSPAYASLNRQEKLKKWMSIKQYTAKNS